jgi:hypothetical protein
MNLHFTGQSQERKKDTQSEEQRKRKAIDAE